MYRSGKLLLINPGSQWLASNLILVALLSSVVVSQQSPQLLVGPNVLASRDRDGVAWETHIAADPTRPNHLLGTGIVTRTDYFNKKGKDSMARTYHSSDGGNTWRTIEFPTRDFNADPQVAFTPTGTALHISTAFAPLGTRVYRSSDGGTNWDAANYLQFIDHPQVVVDNSNGPYRGNIYVAGLRDRENEPGNPRNDTHGHIQIFRSTDDGRTWSALIEVANTHTAGRSYVGMNSSVSPLVFSDGELFVPIQRWVKIDRTALAKGQYFAFATSIDGGRTFSQLQNLTTSIGEELRSNGSFPVYTIDQSKGPFRDRIYVAWVDDGAWKSGPEPNYTRLLTSYSSNRGKTWSTPQVILAYSRVGGMGARSVTVAVNYEGSLAVSWVEQKVTRVLGSTIPTRTISRYMTVSIDGGNTYPPAIPVSSEAFATNQLQAAGAEAAGTFVQFAAGWQREMGQDYQGLVADGKGDFHPFWVDSRTGRTQIWTATVRVVRGPVEVPSNLVEKDVSGFVEVSLDPLREFSPEGTIELPIRIRNMSDRRIFGPLIVEIESMPEPDAARGDSPKNEVLNSTNGQRQVGAAMDYSKALGTIPWLPPGAVSEAVVWRFKKLPWYSMKMKLKIKGRVENKP